MGSTQRLSGFGLVFLMGICAVNAQPIEEIIVTATKRGAVSVQDIPAGIKAVTGDFIKDHELRTFDDIARVEPSLQFAKSAIGDLQPIIRGIQSPGAGTVGVYFDETVITGQNFQDGGGRTPDIGAYDLARVEILKGPQGTLFGASSMTGTVRLISNKPDASGFAADVAVRGNGLKDGDAGYGANGMVNVPVIDDVLALRAVAWYEYGSGFIDHFVGLNGVTANEDADEYDKVGGRIMMRFTPNENITLDAFALYQEIEVDGPNGFSDVPTGHLLPVTFIVGPPNAVGLVHPPLAGEFGDRVMTTQAAERSSSDVLLFGATAEVDFGFGSVVGTVSKFENDPYKQTWDTSAIATGFFLVDPVPATQTGVDVPPFFVPGVPFPVIPGARLGITTPWSISQTQVRDVLSAELRFTSDFDGPVNFVAGWFYQDQDQRTDLVVMRADPVTGEALCDFHPDCIADPTSQAAMNLVFGSDNQVFIESFALFGHVDWEITEKITLGGGVRYYEADEQDIQGSTQDFQGSNPPTNPPSFGGPVQLQTRFGLDAQSKVDELTWDASLAYRHTDTQLFYFRAATGFRQGGINDSNQAAQLNVVIPDFFFPDTVLSIEAGAKTSWFDERVTANATYFHMWWDDIQVPGQDPSGTVNFVGNAAAAEIDGVELELAARPTDQWYLTFGLTWIDAALTEDQIVDGPLGLGFPGGFNGDKVPKVPEWALSGSADYRFPFQLIEGVETALRANYSYRDGSTRFFNDTFENNNPIGDYFLMDLSANFEYKNWDFRVFVRNVTDKSAVIDEFASGVDAKHKITVEPRALGAQLRWHFE